MSFFPTIPAAKLNYRIVYIHTAEQRYLYYVIYNNYLKKYYKVYHKKYVSFFNQNFLHYFSISQLLKF